MGISNQELSELTKGRTMIFQITWDYKFLEWKSALCYNLPAPVSLAVLRRSLHSTRQMQCCPWYPWQQLPLCPVWHHPLSLALWIPLSCPHSTRIFINISRPIVNLPFTPVDSCFSLRLITFNANLNYIHSIHIILFFSNILLLFLFFYLITQLPFLLPHYSTSFSFTSLLSFLFLLTFSVWQSSFLLWFLYVFSDLSKILNWICSVNVNRR